MQKTLLSYKKYFKAYRKIGSMENSKIKDETWRKKEKKILDFSQLLKQLQRVYVIVVHKVHNAIAIQCVQDLHCIEGHSDPLHR